MVKLFVSDIDGCLSVPFQPFRLDRLEQIRSMGLLSQSDSAHPHISICSGRSYAYVEAMTQLLGITKPVLFESGGGMIFPDSMRFKWNPAFNAELGSRVSAIREWCSVRISGSGLWIDAAKHTQAGVAGSKSEIEVFVHEFRVAIESDYPDMVVTHTEVSIDIVPRALTKEEGIRWLADDLGLHLDEIAYIGDANGDIGALGVVGHSFAPANAANDVKAAVGTVTIGSDVDGVIEAYNEVVHRNRAL